MFLRNLTIKVLNSTTYLGIIYTIKFQSDLEEIN